MKFIGIFPYNAMVLTKRGRKPHRDVLFAPMEYEIAEISKTEMERGVVSTVDTWIHEQGPYRDRHPRRTDYWGWKGALWSQPIQGYRMGAASLRDECTHMHPTMQPHTSPFATLMQAFHGRGMDGITQQHHTSHLEENYVGEIVSSERDRAAAEFRKACDDVVLAGRELLTRRCEPTIAVGAASNPGIGIVPWPEFPVPRDLFRLDRLDDAEEWRRRNRIDGEFAGRIIRADPAYLKRDDLSHYVANSLPGLVGKHFAPFLPYLPPSYLSAWQSLGRIAEAAMASPDIALPEGVGIRRALATLRTLHAALEGMSVLPDRREARDRMLDTYARFFRRVEFELERRPPPEFDPEDDAALAGLAP